jgi:predicted  nucleic acid-binding Zn-ribbon protein
MAKATELKVKINKLWKRTKKDLEIAIDNTTKLIKKGEGYIKEFSEKGKEKIEALNITVKREKLYYQLGKTIASTPKSRWTSSKKLDKILKEIKNLTKEIKKKNKK